MAKKWHFPKQFAGLVSGSSLNLRKVFGSFDDKSWSVLVKFLISIPVLQKRSWKGVCLRFTENLENAQFWLFAPYNLAPKGPYCQKSRNNEF